MKQDFILIRRRNQGKFQGLSQSRKVVAFIRALTVFSFRLVVTFALKYSACGIGILVGPEMLLVHRGWTLSLPNMKLGATA